MVKGAWFLAVAAIAISVIGIPASALTPLLQNECQITAKVLQREENETDLVLRVTAVVDQKAENVCYPVDPNITPSISDAKNFTSLRPGQTFQAKISLNSPGTLWSLGSLRVTEETVPDARAQPLNITYVKPIECFFEGQVNGVKTFDYRMMRIDILTLTLLSTRPINLPCPLRVPSHLEAIGSAIPGTIIRGELHRTPRRNMVTYDAVNVTYVSDPRLERLGRGSLQVTADWIRSGEAINDAGKLVGRMNFSLNNYTCMARLYVDGFAHVVNYTTVPDASSQCAFSDIYEGTYWVGVETRQPLFERWEAVRSGLDGVASIPEYKGQHVSVAPGKTSRIHLGYTLQRLNRSFLDVAWIMGIATPTPSPVQSIQSPQPTPSPVPPTPSPRQPGFDLLLALAALAGAGLLWRRRFAG